MASPPPPCPPPARGRGENSRLLLRSSKGGPLTSCQRSGRALPSRQGGGPALAPRTGNGVTLLGPPWGIRFQFSPLPPAGGGQGDGHAPPTSPCWSRAS